VRRSVRHSNEFLAKARSLFPPGGSTTGRASFEQFERLILRAAELQFSRQFDHLPVAIHEIPSIRYVMTHAVPYFPPLIIYAVLMSDGATGTIETIDLEVDEDYWDLIADDPDD